ncbi:hypothetical protein THAOC_29410 [Thalassiosira oceanica]|uniref:Uncharacterized protein n=1 Tax=Thalassiosira oceanica TaxID=159749 RepID=K0RR81_THAOC|nr:hypothetical protein THAOC_29410 [Thalassiosira oceanica]|eukprot:EJK51416.1 hypothetical protein THAOC_29410 [Thalassiosira oceanica]
MSFEPLLSAEPRPKDRSEHVKGLCLGVTVGVGGASRVREKRVVLFTCSSANLAVSCGCCARAISSQVSIPESSAYSRLSSDSRDERFRDVGPGPSSENRLLRVGGVDVGFSLIDEDRAVATYVVLLYDSTLESAEVEHRAHTWYEPTVDYLEPRDDTRRDSSGCEFSDDTAMQGLLAIYTNVHLEKGNGLWHQRRAGIATFVGVRSNIPTVGVGKTFYSIDGNLTKNQVHEQLEQALLDWHGSKPNEYHTFQNDRIIVDDRKIGEFTNVRREGETLAYALVGHGGRGGRASVSSRGSKNPIYISVGSGITLQDAVYICAKVSIAKIPEPIREADLYGRRLVREREQGVEA